MINREATIRWKGYDPNNLKPHSNKKVWVNCDICGIGRWVEFRHYKNLCKSCSHIGNIQSIKTREKISKNNGKGMLGKKPSNKTREIWSKQRKGRKLTEEHKKKISDGGGNRLGQYHSEKSKKKMKQASERHHIAYDFNDPDALVVILTRSHHSKIHHPKGCNNHKNRCYSLID